MQEPAAERADKLARSVVWVAVWRARWLVVAAAVVAGLGGYLYSAGRPAVYTAQTSMVFSANQAFDPLGQQSVGDAARFLSDQVATLTSTPILQPVAQTLGIDVGQLRGSLAVAGSPSDNVVTVTATAGTASAAADRANAVVNSYQSFVRRKVDQVSTGAQLATQDPQLTNQIRTRAVAYGDGVSVVDPASPPAAPSSPNPVRDGGILAGLAALLVIGFALFRRPSVTPDAALAAEGAGVLGTVPVRPVRRGVGPAVDPAEHAMTLVALDYARKDRGGPLLITDVGQDRAAASAAYGVAVSAAAQGRRVLLVDADPGARELVVRAGGTAPSMCLEALGRTPAPARNQVLVPVPVDAPDAPAIMLAVVGDQDGVPVDSRRVLTALERLDKSVDLVIFQTAPLTTSPLAYALAGCVAGVVAVAPARQATRGLRALRERLEVSGRPLIGVVMTRHARTSPIVGRPVPAEGGERPLGMVSPDPGLSGTRR